jgi:hypothetical protein
MSTTKTRLALTVLAVLLPGPWTPVVVLIYALGRTLDPDTPASPDPPTPDWSPPRTPTHPQSPTAPSKTPPEIERSGP